MEIEMSYQNDTELKEFEESYFEEIAQIILNRLKLDGYFIFQVNLVDLKTLIEQYKIRINKGCNRNG